MAIYLDDRKLIKRLLAGEEAAFQQYFDENFGRLYRFALARTSHDQDIAAEIVQAALSRALQKAHTYRGESALFTWLCAICRNEISDWMKRNSRYKQHIVLTEDYPEIQAAVDSFLVPNSDDPGRHYQKHEASRLIQVALDKLPPKYGDVLEWKYIEGFSVKEIALKMDLSPIAVQSLLARAKTAFKEMYSTLARPVFNEAQT